MKRLPCLLVLIIAAALPIGASLAGLTPIQQINPLLELKGVDYLRSVELGDGEHKWKLIAHRYQGEVRFSVFDQDRSELIFHHAEPDISNRFIREAIAELPQYPSPLIVSTWQRGVHGEQFILIDLLKGTVIYRVTSAWPLTTKICDDRILITISTHTDDEGMPVEEIHHWYGPGRISIHKDGETDC